MKCPACKAEIDDSDVAEHVQEDLYADGWRNMENAEHRDSWLSEYASDYGFMDTGDSGLVSDFVSEEAENLGYIHKDDLPEGVPEEIQRELWQLKLITINQEVTWDDLLHMLRGLQ